VIPAPIAALKDRRLRRTDLIVYGVALEALSFYEPRRFKVRVVGRAAHLHFPDASRAIRRLVVLGYLESGPTDGRSHTYLLRSTVETRVLVS